MTPSSSKRKRSSAFDDFPVEEGQPNGKLNYQTSPAQAQQAPPRMERIERLKPSEMLPDRFQPRRLLPSPIRFSYYSGEIDCYEAARRWITLARQDRAYQTQIDNLLMMGESFEEHGQIKPITGSWVTAADGRFVFVIETGERRFWAACLRAVMEKADQEPQLRVEVVEKPTRQRQVIENRHAEMPSAVGHACEIASLILAELDIQPSAEKDDEFDYFRQARSQRMPAGLWEKVTPVMQLSRPRMVQLLNILQFSTPLLELADRYRLPERVLREILSQPEEKWESLLRISIRENLTSDEIEEAARSQKSEKTESKEKPKNKKKIPSLVAAGGLRRFINALRKLEEIDQAQTLDELADELVVSGQAEETLYWIEELHNLVRVRLDNVRLDSDRLKRK